MLCAGIESPASLLPAESRINGMPVACSIFQCRTPVSYMSFEMEYDTCGITPLDHPPEEKLNGTYTESSPRIYGLADCLPVIESEMPVPSY